MRTNIWRSIAIYALIALLLWGVWQLLFGQPAAQVIPYATLKEMVTQGKVANVDFGETQLSGTLKDGSAFTSEWRPGIDLDFIPILEQNKVSYTFLPPPSNWLQMVLIYGLPLLLLIGFWYFMYRQSQGGGNQAFSFGKSKARLFLDDRPRVTFNDVAGVDEVKEELQEEIEFLKNPKKFQALGAKLPKGVLLVGPPGCGKTLLARALAGEAGVPFFSVSGSEFVEMFVGVGASRVRDLFSQAKKYAPCIVFIDEIDAVGRLRGAGLGGGHDEREQTLNQLLVEMDGFDANVGVIIVAATNRPDILDPALLRPGRFDRRVVVDAADMAGREAILRIHARNKPLENPDDMKTIAQRTPGFTGADLENVMNEAALLAGRLGKSQITNNEINEAIERTIAGPQRKSRLVSEKEKEIIALHETGHALVGRLLPGADPVQRISIISRGMALGYTIQMPTEDRHVRTKEELLNMIAFSMGGRAAEQEMLGEITTGAKNDFQKATELARQMVSEWGMSDKLGPISYSNKEEMVFLGRDLTRERNYSEAVALEIDEEIRKVITGCYEAAVQIILTNRTKLRKIADILKQREVLEGDELERLLTEESAAA
ncbi:MAG: ATP-dependent zinc metalloprotease FtsH [Coprothermobacterota bacterium]|nr:ATP-dependent zinc metalloprotease FtsH [Coprothermobacterota bacterium]